MLDVSLKNMKSFSFALFTAIAAFTNAASASDAIIEAEYFLRLRQCADISLTKAGDPRNFPDARHGKACADLIDSVKRRYGDTRMASPNDLSLNAKEILIAKLRRAQESIIKDRRTTEWNYELADGDEDLRTREKLASYLYDATVLEAMANAIAAQIEKLEALNKKG